jgi:hypothetical protein
MDLFKAKSRHWCTVSKSANTKDTSRTGTLYEGLNPQSSTSADAHSWEVHGLVAGKPPFTTGGRGSRRDCRFARRRARGKTGEVSIGPQLTWENDGQSSQMLCHGRSDRRQLELPVVLPHLGWLPGLPQLNVTSSELDICRLSPFCWPLVGRSAVCRCRRKKLFVRGAGMNTEDERSCHTHAPVFESAL